MASSLLALLDDITSVLDDVSVMTKVATKKTAGVLGDDLALNAHQVSGVKPDRELPVVWAVAKGSLVNKAILVPAALAISALETWLKAQGFPLPIILPLLMAGGAFLCFEGAEKLIHRFLHPPAQDEAEHQALSEAAAAPDGNLVAFEHDKIRGAIRTDFILSAEIIVISLGAVAGKAFAVQLGTLVAIALIMTVGVYGLVAGIVKMDDAGLALSQQGGDSGWSRFRRALGRGILYSAPWLMKFLSVAGTAAMFLVGGGILVHGIGVVHHALQAITPEGGLGTLVSMLGNGLFGVVAGLVLVALLGLYKRIRGQAPEAG